MDKDTPDFTVISGGASDDRGPAAGKYLRSEATMTRLTGAFGIHITRRTARYDTHQFFFIDVEKNGFDDYGEFRLDRNHGSLSDVVREMKQLRFGALGGKWRPITKGDAERLIADAALFNKEHGLELPPGEDRYRCYIDEAPEYSPEQRLALMRKICVQPRCDSEAINYYLMRCCGMDREGAEFLWNGDDFTDVVKAGVPSLFAKNTITAAGKGHYRCESLIHADDDFYDLVTEIVCSEKRVSSARRISFLPISAWEASLQLKRDEYVVVAESDCDPEDLYDEIHTCYLCVADYEHEAGTLYLLFNDNNDNVMSPEYRPDDDAYCRIAVLDSGEILISGPYPGETSAVAAELEDLITYELGGSYSTIENYCFSSPMLARFLDSGYPSFMEFLYYLEQDPGHDS